MTDSNQFIRIGAGSYGEIYHQPNDPNAPALKWPKPAQDSDCLWSMDWGYTIQKRIHAALASSGIDIAVPSARALIAADSDWWTTHLALFPLHIEPKDTLSMDRIPALSSPIRTGLANAYCPSPSKREAILAEPAAADGLARVFLGRRRETSRPARFFSLRNFNLRLDMLEELRVDVGAFADTMAQTLAVLHWVVCCDARDVEFLLGSAEGPSNHELFGEAVQLYLLDFNQVRAVKRDEEGVRMMVQAHATNDPYYPRPCAERDGDRELWGVFRDAYLAASWRIVKKEAGAKGEILDWAGLPERFIDGVVEARRAKIAENAKLALA